MNNDPGSADQILVKLHADGRAELFLLTRAQPGTRQRIREFAHAIVETPSFPAFEEVAR